MPYVLKIEDSGAAATKCLSSTRFSFCGKEIHESQTDVTNPISLQSYQLYSNRGLNSCFTNDSLLESSQQQLIAMILLTPSAHNLPSHLHHPLTDHLPNRTPKTPLLPPQLYQLAIPLQPPVPFPPQILLNKVSLPPYPRTTVQNVPHPRALILYSVVSEFQPVRSVTP